MGLSGHIAGGMQSALDDVLDRRLREEIRRFQETQAKEALALQERQIAGVEADRAANRENQRKQINLAELTRVDEQNAAGEASRARSNMAGVLEMGLDPQTTQREIVGTSLRSGTEVPRTVLDLIKIPEVKRHPITTAGPNGQPLRKLVTEAELEAGVPEYREPKTPTAPARDPIADHEARLKLDAKYKQPGSSDPVAEAKETASEAKRIATALKDHPGLDGAFGVIKSKLPTFQQATADAEVLRDALTSLLTLENTGKLKGVLSNADMAILRQASTTIAAPMSPEAARAELKRVAEVMGRAAGEGGLPKMDMATSRGNAAPNATPKRLRFDAKGNPIP